MNNDAQLDTYIKLMGLAHKALETMTTFVVNNGTILPEDITWSHVGRMVEIVKGLQDTVQNVEELSTLETD